MTRQIETEKAWNPATRGHYLSTYTIQTEKFHTPKLTTKHHTSRIKVLYLLKNLNIKEI